MKVHFTDHGWEDYLHWASNDADTLRRVNEIIQDIRRSPFHGLGKPEPLKGSLKGYWSRRITKEHRLVYGVAEAGDDQRVVVLQFRYHY